MEKKYTDLIDYICHNLTKDERAKFLKDIDTGSTLADHIKHGGLNLYEKIDWFDRARQNGDKVSFIIDTFYEKKHYYTDKHTKEFIYWDYFEMTEEEAKYYLNNKENVVNKIINSEAARKFIPAELYDTFVKDYVLYHAADLYPGSLQVIDIVFQIANGFLKGEDIGKYIERYNEFCDERKMWVRRCIEKYFIPKYKEMFFVELGIEEPLKIINELFANIVVPHCISQDVFLLYARRLMECKDNLSELKNYFYVIITAEALYKRNNQLDSTNNDFSMLANHFDKFDSETKASCKEFIKSFFNDEYQALLTENLNFGNQKQ